jgi:cell wall-associated NlpC family hydrolase
MFPVGFILFSLAAYLLDCAITNRPPIATLEQIIANPGHMRETLASTRGTGFTSEFISASELTADAAPTATALDPNGPLALLGPESAASDVAKHAVSLAKTQVGKPYKWGAVGPNAFDCSGLIYWAYKHAGVTIPRTTATMLASPKLLKVKESELLPGDLVFPYPGHVFLYAGNGMMVEAPHTGAKIHVAKVYKFWTARRVVLPKPTPQGTTKVRAQ